MNTNTNPNPRSIRVVLRLRTLAPHGINKTQTEIIDQLQWFEADDRIAELDIDVWGGSIASNRTADRDPSRVGEMITEFEQWADEHDCTLRPAFEQRNARTTGEERVVLPLLCLAIYDANSQTVQAVYPHVNGEDVYTIHDGIEELELLLARSEGSPGQTNEDMAPPRP